MIVYFLALIEGLIQRGSNINNIQYQRAVSSDSGNNKNKEIVPLTFVAAQASDGKQLLHFHHNKQLKIAYHVTLLLFIEGNNNGSKFNKGNILLKL